VGRQVTQINLTPDFCVIGAGSGGLSFAAGAAQMGASVVLLESKKMGGDCLNYGCVPSKALIAAAKSGFEARRAKGFGWAFSDVSVDYKKVHEHIHDVIKAIAPNDSVERFEKLGVKVILEQGRFVDSETVVTKTHRIQAKRFIIATGSIPFVPPIDGLSETPYLTNETIFDLTELPYHLVVIGGGPIGIEIAQAFKRLGSHVTVLEAFTILPKDDPDLTLRLKETLSQEGVELCENVKISSVQHNNEEIIINYLDDLEQTNTIVASHVMIATGRRPNIQGLGLETAGIKFSPRGIEVSEQLQTSNPRVYAIGDCTGGYQFTHAAGYEAGLALRNTIFGLRTKVETRTIPWVTYTDPELAHVGFLESQLQQKNISYKVLQMSFDENDRAQAEKRTDGMIKVLVSKKGTVLGASILGVHAGELIYPWVMAIQNNLKLTAITSSIAPYPTLGDLSKRIAGSFYADKIFSPIVRRIVRFLMKWFR